MIGRLDSRLQVLLRHLPGPEDQPDEAELSALESDRDVPALKNPRLLVRGRSDRPGGFAVSPPVEPRAHLGREPPVEDAPPPYFINRDVVVLSVGQQPLLEVDERYSRTKLCGKPVREGLKVIVGDARIVFGSSRSLQRLSIAARSRSNDYLRVNRPQSVRSLAGLTLHFEGRAIPISEGDTVASALYRGGVRVFSRSFKYHRRRGLYCLTGDCPNCMVTVDGEGSTRSCITEAQPGQRVSREGSWPSVDHDALAVVDRVHRLVPVGFYYKSLIRPEWAWQKVEPWVRRAAGRGIVEESRPPVAREVATFIGRCRGRRRRRRPVCGLGRGRRGTLGCHLRRGRVARSSPRDGRATACRVVGSRRLVAEHHAARANPRCRDLRGAACRPERASISAPVTSRGGDCCDGRRGDARCLRGQRPPRRLAWAWRRSARRCPRHLPGKTVVYSRRRTNPRRMSRRSVQPEPT